MRKRLIAYLYDLCARGNLCVRCKSFAGKQLIAYVVRLLPSSQLIAYVVRLFALEETYARLMRVESSFDGSALTDSL